MIRFFRFIWSALVPADSDLTEQDINELYEIMSVGGGIA